MLTHRDVGQRTIAYINKISEHGFLEHLRRDLIDTSSSASCVGSYMQSKFIYISEKMNAKQ